VLERTHALLCQRSARPPEGVEFPGAGVCSGFLALRAHRLFLRLALVDISQAMLDGIELLGARKLVVKCDIAGRAWAP
jgi:hypothetical protein